MTLTPSAVAEEDGAERDLGFGGGHGLSQHVPETPAADMAFSHDHLFSHASQYPAEPNRFGLASQVTRAREPVVGALPLERPARNFGNKRKHSSIALQQLPQSLEGLEGCLIE